MVLLRRASEDQRVRTFFRKRDSEYGHLWMREHYLRIQPLRFPIFTTALLEPRRDDRPLPGPGSLHSGSRAFLEPASLGRRPRRQTMEPDRRGRGCRSGVSIAGIPLCAQWPGCATYMAAIVVRVGEWGFGIALQKAIADKAERFKEFTGAPRRNGPRPWIVRLWSCRNGIRQAAIN